MASGGVGRTAVALARACHPGPSLAVTAFGAGLAAQAGAGAGRTSLVGAAVLSGQLGIGWLNDLLDADVDAAAGRTGKPVAAGDVARPVVRAAVLVSAVTCVVLSVLLGPVAAGLHLAAVAAAWAYDLRLKRTAASVVPFLVSFGLLPAVAAAAAGSTPSAALVGAAALLGAAGHLADTLPDVAADRLTNVRGLPQRLGPVVAQRGAAACVVAACAVAALGSQRRAAGLVALAVAALLGGLGALVPRARAFALVVAATGAALVGVVLAG